MSIVPPLPLQIALERGLCRYVHLTVMITLPPPTGGTPVFYVNVPLEMLEGIQVRFPKPNRVELAVAPPRSHYVWKTFALSWGALTPAGISRKIVITHWHKYMIIHEDPFLHSLVDYTYPHNLVLRGDQPEYLVIENLEDTEQTIDVTFHIMCFETREQWEEYQRMLQETARIEGELREARGLLESLRDLLRATLERLMGARRVDDPG